MLDLEGIKKRVERRITGPASCHVKSCGLHFHHLQRRGGYGR